MRYPYDTMNIDMDPRPLGMKWVYGDVAKELWRFYYPEERARITSHLTATDE